VRGVAKRLERWTNDVRRWNGTTFTLQQRSIEALSRAEKHFGLDRKNEHDRLHLLYILADIVFGVGRRGRPPASKKWKSNKLWQLAKDHIAVKKDLPKLSNTKAAEQIKKRYPDRYKHTSAEMVRQMLPEAHFEREFWEEVLAEHEDGPVE
jgi:hypothetical protein